MLSIFASFAHAQSFQGHWKKGSKVTNVMVLMFSCIVSSDFLDIILMAFDLDVGTLA